MGDPKKQRKKYSTPNHPWNKERIELEKNIIKEYGIRRKKEIWKMQSVLKKLQRQTKTITGSTTKQSEVEKVNLLNKIYRWGLLPKKSKLGDILNLQLKDILERRLQTIVLRKKLANSMLQARQFIIHEHISVNGKKITTPSYLVCINEEAQISYSDDSALKSVKPQEDKKQEKEVKPSPAQKKEVKAS